MTTLGFFMPVSIVAALSAATQRSFKDPINTSVPLIFSSPRVCEKKEHWEGEAQILVAILEE